MKTPYIVIGRKGTALPVTLDKLPEGIEPGFHKVPWTSENPSPLAVSLIAWVAARDEELEVRLLEQALREERVNAFDNVAWQKHGRRFTGTAFMPSKWKPGDPHPQYVAVDCAEWGHGVVEAKLVYNRKTGEPANERLVAALNFSKAVKVGSGNSRTIHYVRRAERSEFLAPITDELRAAGTLFVATPVSIDVGVPGGYSGDVEVRISGGETFEVDQDYADETRFPARLRAVATALRDIAWSGRFQISHKEGAITITRLTDDFAPTADDDELNERAKRLGRSVLKFIPGGIKKPLRTHGTCASFVRDPAVKVWVLQNANGQCEACDERAPFLTDDEEPFLEVHHVKALSVGGSDRVTNAVAVCPNCHRRFHHSVDRMKFTDAIYERVSRLVREDERTDSSILVPLV